MTANGDVGIERGLRRLLSLSATIRSPEQERADLLCGFALHVLNDVAVEVESDADVGVAEPLRHHLRVYACRERQRRGRVSKIVQRDGRWRGGGRATA